MMAFDFDMMYVKGNTIPHINTETRVWLRKGRKTIKCRKRNATLGGNGRFSSKSTLNENKTRPRIKQDTRQDKEKYMEQLLNSRETLQITET